MMSDIRYDLLACSTGLLLFECSCLFDGVCSLHYTFILHCDYLSM